MVLLGTLTPLFSRDLDKRRSLIGYAFTIGGCAISWKVTLHTIVAFSTIKVEYMAITEACKEAIWLKGFLGEICDDLQTTTVFYDSQESFFSRKIRCSMRGQNTLMFVTALFVRSLLMVTLLLVRLALMIILLI